MIKPLSISLATFALAGSLATSAMADEGANREDIDSLLRSAGEYGFSQFEEFSVDDDDQFEIEGWRDDGWQLDVDMATSDGSILREQQRRSETPDWSLSADDIDRALDSAQQAGIEHIASLDVDPMGRIEVEGYDDRFRELEVRLNRETFEVLGVEHDD
ncbi:PepSY domain-containing protein [Halomonas huangheensis]|nr:PepSY domain-containing protein [Halomonas huangheensis]